MEKKKKEKKIFGPEGSRTLVLSLLLKDTSFKLINIMIRNKLLVCDKTDSVKPT